MRPLVIIPTYNERANVQRLVPQLLEIPGLRVLVVDDMSPDGTGFAAEVLAEHSNGRVSVMHHLGRPRGLGRATLDGIRRALESDADVICQMDASLSHQPEQLVAMLDAVRRADLVIGSRFVPGASITNVRLHHRLSTLAVNCYIRAVGGIGVRDCTSSFRCWRRDALAALPLHRIDAEGAACLVHLLCDAIANGCAITEVPIAFAARATGAKQRPRFAAEFAALPWKLTHPTRGHGAPAVTPAR